MLLHVLAANAATPMGVTASGLGSCFGHNSPRFLKTANSTGMSLRSHSPFDVAGRDSNVRARRYVRSLIDKTRAYFGQHQADHLKLIRDHLIDLLDARPPQSQANNLRSAWSLLDKQAEAFNSAFQAALQVSMDEELLLVLPEAPASDFREEIQVDAPDSTSLSLIDLSEVERMLLVDRVAQRFAAPYGASVSLLTQRLAVLLGLDKPTQTSNPFRPDVFVRAFLLAWEKSGLDDQATEDLVQSLQPQHSIDLAPLYADLNAMLEQAGIEAQTGHRIKRSEDAAGASRFATASAPLSGGDETPANSKSALGTSASAGARSDWAGLAPVGRSVAAHARQFLHRLGWGTPSTGEDAGDGVRPANTAVDPEFMGYLGNLQAGADASPSLAGLQGQDPANHNILRQMLDRDEVRRAPELDRGTVDALAEVFDFVFADPAIPVQMKFVIGRLQIPVLRAAMIDRDFFLSADHPARRLIDTLAQASIGWTPDKGEDDPLYQRVESTVKRAVTEFDDNLELFSALLLEFKDYLLATEQQVQVQIEPKADEERVGESLEQALAHADEVVHARLSTQPPELPLAPFLVPFLTTQWREVMAKAWLNVQADSAPWESALTTMDQLIWSTQPKTRASEGRELVAVLPDLVSKMNMGLDAIGWTGEERAAFTRRLISTHMRVIRVKSAAKADPVAVQEESVGKEAMKQLGERLATQVNRAEDEFDAMAKTFTRGLWFDFTVDKNTQHRCRLSWVSPMRTRMLFTNRDGFDAFVCSERQVAKLLRRGRLSVIDQLPIVSRALDRIMADEEPSQVA